jgi:hypothetical protein
MHRIHSNFQFARSKFYDECLARDLGVAESSQVKFAAAVSGTLLRFVDISSGPGEGL